MADLWLSQIRSNPHLQKLESQAAMDFIHDVITGLLSPLDAASSISCTHESTIKRNEADLWSLWTIVIDAVHQLILRDRPVATLGGVFGAHVETSRRD